MWPLKIEIKKFNRMLSPCKLSSTLQMNIIYDLLPLRSTPYPGTIPLTARIETREERALGIANIDISMEALQRLGSLP